MAKTSKDRRRSQRLAVQIPAVLKGTDSASRDFFERTEIVSFDQRGAGVRTRFLLTPGTEVEVQLLTEKDLKRLRVVWRGEPDSLHAGLVGLELVDPDDTWSPATLRAQWEAREF